MASTEPDRSLPSGISLPQWMKSKMGDRYDMQEAAAFSPPSQDDSFFYIRYPRPGWGSAGPDQTQGPHYRPVAEILEDVESGHKLIPDDVPDVSQTRQPPLEVDPGCGKSVVDVAQLMISARFSAVRGLNSSDCTPATSEGFDFSQRRGSKSLPASPLHSPETSPRTPRRTKQNRYFTNAFVPTPQETQQQCSQVETVRPPGGWILASFLGQTRDRELVLSQDLLRVDSEGEERQDPADLRRNKSSSSLPLGSIGEEESASGRLHTFQAKPSELREMNFWSPTSM